MDIVRDTVRDWLSYDWEATWQNVSPISDWVVANAMTVFVVIAVVMLILALGMIVSHQREQRQFLRDKAERRRSDVETSRSDHLPHGLQGSFRTDR